LILTLTAAVCTRNRAGWTRKAVQSLLAQDLPADRLDIVVIDNGSTDDTAAVVAALAAGNPHLRYESEPEPGLSRARNRAIRTAKGDVVAFLDDDAVADRSWARRHLEAFEAAPDVQATGGRIDLVWPNGRPDWFPAERAGMYAGLDLGDSEHDLPAPGIPYGANMAVRRSVFERIEPFALDLGRQGSGLLSGEERDLFERIRSVGGRIRYLPDAAVGHHVLPDRVDPRWLLRRCYDQGRSEVAMDVHRRSRGGRVYWLGRSAFQAARALRWASVGAAQSVARRPAAARTVTAARAAQAAGTSVQSARTARHPPTARRD
jgi:glucosyl-dolichyl phosphate glucuronosyltransferase